jgi:metal-responsive CopG/Arc/MetJ family transcriptional regulator
MKPAKTPKQLLAISCSTELVAAIDEIAAREMRSRSDVVRQACSANWRPRAFA